MQEPADPLVKKQRQYGDHHAFQKIERTDREDHKGRNIMDPRVYCGSHFDQGIHWDSVKLGESRKKIPCIEQSSEYSHNKGACYKSDQSARSVLPGVINNDCRKHR